MVEQAKFTIVLGFTGNIPSHYEVIQWLQSLVVLGGKDKADSATYLAKGFYSMRFKEEDDVRKILWKCSLFYNRVGVCVIRWEPIFDTTESLQGIHMVWIEFVGLPCWLWGSLRKFASWLGTPLFVPDKQGMGQLLNTVCIGWNVEKTPPKSMAINVGVGYKIIQLHFGTFFGACFKCNKFGHFAKQCPTTKASKEKVLKKRGYGG